MHQNIYLFFGENTYLQREKLTLWKQEFVKKHGDLNLVEVDGARTTPNELLMHTNQLPFLGEKKLVIVYDFLTQDTEVQKTFLELIEKVADFTILVFAETGEVDKRHALFKFLSTRYKKEEFLPIENTALTEWIVREVKKRDAEIDYKEAGHLTESVGVDMNELICEIEKLSLYRIHNKIRREDIDTLVTGKITQNIFKLTDAIATKNLRTAVQILEKLIASHEEVPRIFHMIVRQFRILVQIRSCLDRNMSQSEIRLQIPEHPFVIANGIKQATHFSVRELIRIYEHMLDIERKFKTGKIRITTDDQSEFATALHQFVIRSCKVAPSIPS